MLEVLEQQEKVVLADELAVGEIQASKEEAFVQLWAGVQEFHYHVAITPLVESEQGLKLVFEEEEGLLTDDLRVSILQKFFVLQTLKFGVVAALIPTEGQEELTEVRSLLQAQLLRELEDGIALRYRSRLPAVALLESHELIGVQVLVDFLESGRVGGS